MTNKAFFALVLIFLYATSAFASLKEDVKKGNILYNNKKYTEARKVYEDAISKNPNSAIAAFNLGASLYGEGTHLKAIENFNTAIASGKERFVQASDYNIGNAYYRLGRAAEGSDIGKAKERYESAIKFYKRSMDLNPGDRDAKFNYEFVQNRLKQLKETKDKEKDKEDKNKDEKKKEEKKDKNNKDDNKDKDNKPQKDPRGGGSGEGESEKKEDKKDKGEQGEGQQPDGAKEKSPESEKEKSGGGTGEDESRAQESNESQKEEKDKKDPKKDDSTKGAGQGEEKGEEEKDKDKADQGQGGQGKEERREEQEGELQKGEDKGGLAAYQSPASAGEERQMSEQEARMMLEGYKGEEATGRAVHMRKKNIDLPEPSRDW